MNLKKEIERTKKDIEKAITRDQLIVQSTHTLNELNKSINALKGNLRERYSIYSPYSAKEENITELALKPTKEEMGIKLNKEDKDSIKSLAKQIILLEKEKTKQESYQGELMKELCPNLTKVASSKIGAELVTHAGSLKNLSNMASSKVQILGAEKALFRHLKEGAKPPKFGIIFSHPNITKEKNKGKAARQLASKISIAVKKDYFR